MYWYAPHELMFMSPDLRHIRDIMVLICTTVYKTSCQKLCQFLLTLARYSFHSYMFLWVSNFHTIQRLLTLWPWPCAPDDSNREHGVSQNTSWFIQTVERKSFIPPQWTAIHKVYCNMYMILKIQVLICLNN